MKSINKVKYYEYKELIQVSAKEEAESAIIKENTGRFKLMHSFLLLERDLCQELGILGEGKLAENALKNQAILESYLEIKEVLQLFRNGRYKRIKTYITVE